MQTYCARCLLYYYSDCSSFVIILYVCVCIIIIVEINNGDIAATATGRPLGGRAVGGIKNML